jgi:hypothetical protein
MRRVPPSKSRIGDRSSLDSTVADRSGPLFAVNGIPISRLLATTLLTVRQPRLVAIGETAKMERRSFVYR